MLIEENFKFYNLYSYNLEHENVIKSINWNYAHKYVRWYLSTLYFNRNEKRIFINCDLQKEMKKLLLNLSLICS